MLAGFSREKFNSGGTYHFLSKDIESLRGDRECCEKGKNKIKRV